MRLGLFLQGGSIVFIFVAFYVFSVITHYIPTAKTASRAITHSFARVLAYNALCYLLWIVPELLLTRDGLYGSLAKVAPGYEEFICYYDMACLPVSLMLGYAVTYGRESKHLHTFLLVTAYVVLGLIDLALGKPKWFFLTVNGLTIALCIGIFVLYGLRAKAFNVKLRENFSNLEGKDMRWYFNVQIPLFIVALLYLPLCVTKGFSSETTAVLFDAIRIIALMYVATQVLMNCRVDSLQQELIHELGDKGLPVKSSPEMVDAVSAEMGKPSVADGKPESVAASVAAAEGKPEVEVGAPAAEVGKPAVAEAEPERVAASVATAEGTPEAGASAGAAAEPALYEPESVNKYVSFDFTERMQELENKEFFLNPDVNVEWLAAELGTNRHYISNYFNQIAKTTFYDYVNRLRLDYAVRLLATGKVKPSLVGYDSGFNSEATFRRIFKDKYGCTPTQYAKTH